MKKIKAWGCVLLTLLLILFIPYLVGRLIFLLEILPKYGSTLYVTSSAWFFGFITCFFAGLLIAFLNFVYTESLNDNE